jgi:hypothetical protein
MQIETYECETIPSVEFTDEAIALVEKLGATKQSNFYQEGKAVIPYRFMTPIEMAVYAIMLPQRDEINAFDSAPIPLRVLQVGAHAKEVLEDGVLVVWHQGAGKDDPLLTLRIGPSYSGKYYLLARWGEVLEEFSVLMEQASKRHVMKMKVKIAEIKREVESWEANVDILTLNALANGKTDPPHAYWHS